MSTQNALAKYSKAVQAVKDHQEDNKEVFDAHQKLVFDVIDAENELRDAVAESAEEVIKDGLSNGTHKVTVTRQTQRVYNEEKMHQFLSPTQFAQVVNDVTRPVKISITEIK